jgi:hypothetical protein
MDILEEIRTAISTFDPELAKNEDDGVEGSDEEDKDINQDNYQDAIDSAVDPEDLNFSMDPLFDGDDDEEEEEVEQINIPQKDYEENPIQVDDVVKKVTRDDLTGKVLAVGELVEVEWTPDLITLEYPEELIHAEDEEEEDQKLNSLAENPPLPVESPNA